MRNLRASEVEAWLTSEGLVTWSKKRSNNVYEGEADYIFSFSFEHSDKLIVWVKYIVQYIHISIKLLMHVKLMW